MVMDIDTFSFVCLLACLAEALLCLAATTFHDAKKKKANFIIITVQVAQEAENCVNINLHKEPLKR